MTNHVVALFDTRQEAGDVRDELIGAGFNDQSISMIGQPPDQQAVPSVPAAHGKSFREAVKNFFGFGYEEDRAQYEEGVRRGGTFVAVNAPEDRIDRAVDIMMAHHPVDIERRAAEWRTQDWNGRAAPQQSAASSQAAASQQVPRQAAPPSAAAATTRPTDRTIPVIQEELHVGKRQVQQRGVRIYKHVTERPVEKQVQLRDERVTVERRATDRPVTDASRAFQEQAFEVIEMREEPVVTKQARVVEEVVINRDVSERTQTVRDTVRRADVDVQQAGEETGEEDSRRLTRG